MEKSLITDKFLSAKEVAFHLGISTQSARTLIKNKEFGEPTLFGKGRKRQHFKIRLSNFEAWLSWHGCPPLKSNPGQFRLINN